MSEDTKKASGEQVIITRMQRDARILGTLDSVVKKDNQPEKKTEDS